METTDTNNADRIAEGKYTFVISKVPEKIRTTTGKIAYKFHFESIIDGNITRYEERFLPWMCADLLRAIGANEVSPGKFEWEKEQAVGKEIEGDIVYEADRNDPKKSWPRLKNISAKLPF